LTLTQSLTQAQSEPKFQSQSLFQTQTQTGLTAGLIRFYYADERKADGSSIAREISGEAHAALYVSLAGDLTQGPWQQTFVKGVGYKQF
jgi:hypothetical protein